MDDDEYHRRLKKLWPPRRKKKTATKKVSKKKARKVSVNFDQRRRRDTPMFDRGRFGERETRQDNGDWDHFDEILGNFGDWGDH